MKKILFPLFVLVAAIGFQSCSEDFEVAAPYKPVTIVYGMLDMRDTAHYVRIQKAFLDQNKSAFDMAKEADSNFYKESDVDVVIKEYAGGTIVGSPITLTRVNMDNEGYPKESGTFFTAPNYAYKFKASLNPAHSYRLVINNKLNNSMDSAEVRIVDANKLSLFEGDTIQRAISFPHPTTTEKSSLTLDPMSIGVADYIEVVLRFRWNVRETLSGTVTKDSADFDFASISGDEIKSLKLQTESAKLYNFLVGAMGPAAPGTERKLDSCRVFLKGYGKEFYNYVKTLEIQSSGLTADQIKPAYTNIRGKDVFGLFGSRTTKTYNRVYVDKNTLEMLMTNTSLNITGRVQ